MSNANLAWTVFSMYSKFNLLLTPASTLHIPFALHLLTSLQLSVLSCFCKYKSLWAQLFFKLSPVIKLYSKIIIIIVLW